MPIKQSIRQQARGIAQQVAALREALMQLDDVVTSIVETIGPEDIAATKRARQARQIAADTARHDAFVKEGLAHGYVTAPAAVSASSLVVVSETPQDGDTIPRCYIKADEDTVGKPVGFEVKTRFNSLLKVLEIYDVDANKYREHTSAAAREAEERANAPAEASPQEAPEGSLGAEVEALMEKLGGDEPGEEPVAAGA